MADKKKAFSPYFDPDEVAINKEILRKIINAVINRWKSGDKKPFFAIKALETFRVSLRFYKDEEINSIFKSIILTVNEMQMINGMLKLKGEFAKTDVLADLAIQKIESGELFQS